MKRLSYIVIYAAAFTFVGCSNNSAPTNTNGASATHQEGADHNHSHSHADEPYYTCVDHQDVHEHTEGKCPKCQKELVMKVDEPADESHHTYYTCEQHPDVHEHEAGKCPKCQMELVMKEGGAH